MTMDIYKENHVYHGWSMCLEVSKENMLANEITKWKTSFGTKVSSFENSALYKGKQCQLEIDEVHT